MTSPHSNQRPAVLPTLLGLGPRSADRRRRTLPAGVLRLPTIGVDIGGTKVVAGVVDGEGRVLDRVRTETPHRSKSPKVVEDVIVDLVLRLADRHDVHAVGVGAAGWVDADRSRVLFAPTSTGATSRCRRRSASGCASPSSWRTTPTRRPGRSGGSARAAARTTW